MKSFLKLFATMGLLLSVNTVQAGLLIEPYLGYASGTIKSSSSSNYSGVNYGLRAGYASMLGLAVGAEYASGSYSDDDTPKNDLKIADLGLFVAYELPVLLRVYGTYVPSAKIDGSNSAASYTVEKGNTTKLGVGFTGFPFVSVNLEYMMGSYDEISISGQNLSLNPKVTTSAFGLSVSMPLVF